MTITIPEAWLHALIAVLVLWPLAGLTVWAIFSQKRDAERVLGCMAFWPLLLVVLVVEELKDHGWFSGWDWAGEAERRHIVEWWRRRDYHGVRYVGYGTCQTLSGWGSVWVQLGPLHVGRKNAARALLEKPPESERT